MKRFNTFRIYVAGLVLAVTAFTGMASEDHGEGGAASTPAAPPRFSAHSDLFEMVGIVSAGQMVVYVDRFTSNEPVVGAKLDFEAGAAKGTAAPQPDGTYLIKLDSLGKPGNTPFSFTLTAGTETDLLAGELIVGEGHDEHADGGAKPWLRWLAYGLGAAALLAGAVLLIRKQRSKRLRLN